MISLGFEQKWSSPFLLQLKLGRKSYKSRGGGSTASRFGRVRSQGFNPLKTEAFKVSRLSFIEEGWCGFVGLRDSCVLLAVSSDADRKTPLHGSSLLCLLTPLLVKPWPLSPTFPGQLHVGRPDTLNKTEARS